MNDKKEFNTRFGQFVKSLRIQKNWNQNDLADRMENNFQNISRLERGEITPTLFWCEKLAKAFEITLGELINQFENYSTQLNNNQ